MKSVAQGRRVRIWLILMLTTVAGMTRNDTVLLARVGVDAVCVGSFSNTYTPALTTVPAATIVTAETSYNCPLIGPTSGVSADPGRELTISCLNVASGLPPEDEVIFWTGGSGEPSSTIRYTSVTAVAQTLVYRGIVIAGRFTGDDVENVITLAAFSGTGVPLLCPVGLGTIASSGGATALTLIDPS